MKSYTFALIFIIGLGIPLAGQSQTSELGNILNQTLAYEPLKSFLPSGENDQPHLAAILTNNLIPSGTPVEAFGEKVLVKAGAEIQPYSILLKKVKIKPERAQVKFVYHSNLKARMSLKFEDGRWKVHRSYIRMKSLDQNGNKTKKMHWDF